MSQMLFLVMLCDAEGELQGIGEGADGVVSMGVGVGDLRFWLLSRYKVCTKTEL